MKRFIFSSLSALLLTAAIAPIVQAQTAPPVSPTNVQTAVTAATPAEVVSLAYQGFFESEGIPKYGRLIDAAEVGDVTAEDLVKVAIGTRRVSPDVANDPNYLAAVDQHLAILYTFDSN